MPFYKKPDIANVQEREAHEVEVDELNELLREKFNEIKSAEITNKENLKVSDQEYELKQIYYRLALFLRTHFYSTTSKKQLMDEVDHILSRIIKTEVKVICCSEDNVDQGLNNS